MDVRLDTYKIADAAGKSQLDLLIQVYDGALRSLADARGCYERNEAEKGYEHLEQVRRFITHLYTTLDFERGGEIAQNLSRLYVHLLNETSIMQATKDLKQIDDNARVLKNLREGWAGIRPSTSNATGQPSIPEPAEPDRAFVTSA